jgi:Protein of unknown function (DUF3352)
MSKKGTFMAAALVVAAGAGFAGYKYIYSGQTNPGDLAEVIPANAFMAAYVSNEPETWAKLQKFGTPEAQKVVTAQLKDLEQKFVADTKMDFSKDVQPWLGNVMFAFLPNTDGKSTQPRILISIGIKDKLKALDFANKLRASSKEPVKTIDYKGVEITDSGKGNGETFTAVVNDRLVAAPEQRTVEMAIDTAKGEPSLASKAGNDWFKGDSLQLKRPVVAFYIPDYLQGVQQLIKSGSQPTTLDPATMTQLKKIQSFAGGIGVEDNGIRLKLVAKTDGTNLNLPSTSAKSSSYPADTFALIGGTGLSQIWSEVNKVAAANPETQKTFAQMRQSFTQSTQLDLDKDIFSWMGGDYTIGTIPVSGGMMAQAGFGGAMTIDSTDRAVTDNTMTKLASLAKGSGATIEQRKVGNVQISDLKAPGGMGTVMSYGWLSDKSLIVAVGDGLVEKIATPSGETLTGAANFKTTMDAMPDRQQSYAYIDVEKVFGLVNSKLGAMVSQNIPPDVNAIVTSIRGLGMSSTQPDKNTSQFDALLTLKSSEK